MTTTIMMTTTRITETTIRNKLSLPLINWFIEKQRVFELRFIELSIDVPGSPDSVHICKSVLQLFVI